MAPCSRPPPGWTPCSPPSASAPAKKKYNIRKMRKMIIGSVILVLLAALVFAGCRTARSAYESAPYRVVRTDGEPITWSFALTREVLVKELVFWGLPIFLLMAAPPLALVAWLVAVLNLFWPLWDPQNRALHDRLAKTRVVRTTS